GQFLDDVARTAARRGAGAPVLNACADRYHFAVGFAASLVRGKLSLLPSTRTPEVIAQLRRLAPDVVCLTDEEHCDIDLPQLPIAPAAHTRAHPPAPPPARAGAWETGAVPRIDAAQPAAWVFTSGSTGTPVPHRKTFGRLVDCMRIEAERLGFLDGRGYAIVATVPPQHMYGFESSVLAPLAAGCAFAAERPFYPADICGTLAALPRPRILVSTPIHLRALVASGLPLPATDLVVSSTAPLAQQLALEVEARFGTELREIYGSTETGSLAARRPTASAAWRLWSGVQLEARDGETWASGGHIEQPTRMCDVLEVTGGDRFLLHGRLADLVNIAGKRSSLAYLNHQLNSIPGVVDGAFFHGSGGEQQELDAAVTRVGACVVAPGLDAAAILGELRRRIDPVFLPRPLLVVASLPRTSTGKLPQEALRSLAAAHARPQGA
ncbi:MAG TPA: AMP-binding protein, partial [Steroidobacteraceae bacterium]|nr:AMP-binding protein [Steroidobacteraceae bacterium]